MKKVILSLLLISTVLSAVPMAAGAQGAIVQCGGAGQNPCGMKDFFDTLGRIYSFIVKYLVAPIGTLMLIVGAILLLVSAGNPNLQKLGRDAIWAALIGMAIAFMAYGIVKFFLTLLGYQGGGLV